MRTNVQETSIGAFHAHHASGNRSAQCWKIRRFMESVGGDWSIGELARELGMEKSTVSARLNEMLNDTHELVEMPKRKDRISGVRVRPVKLAPEQREMFA